MASQQRLNPRARATMTAHDEDVRNTVIDELIDSEKIVAAIDTLQAMNDSELLQVLLTVLQC
jgi:hypothetical protein